MNNLKAAILDEDLTIQNVIMVEAITDNMVGTNSRLTIGDTYSIELADLGSIGEAEPTYIAPVTIITTGAMQTRFSISEEAAIIGGSDATAKVLHSRLLNAKNINLELEELISGVAYIVTYLHSIGQIYLGATIQERLLKLLEDGTADEAYI